MLKIFNKIKFFSVLFFSFLIHIFTATSCIFGFFSIIYSIEKNFLYSIYMMIITILIDSIDGSLARLFKIKKTIPQIDGSLLDNIVDYFTYVITPMFFLYFYNILHITYYLIFIIIISSLYQFTHKNAKTKDDFFLGFPCYWNIIIIYFYVLKLSHIMSLIILILCVILIFIPIKYIYPSKITNISNDIYIKFLFLLKTVLYFISMICLVCKINIMYKFNIIYSIYYIIFYILFSIYRTYFPINYDKNI